MKKIYVILIIYIIFSFEVKGFENSKQQPLVENGYMDLSEWDFEKGVVSLDGRWKYYPQQLLVPNEEKTNNYSYGYLNVPSIWSKSKYEELGKSIKLGSTGYGTYNLKIKCNEVNNILSFKLPTIGTNYRFFVNGELLSSVGKVAKDKKDAIPAYKPQIIDYIPKTSEMDLVIQVSNFDYSCGGIWYPIVLGSNSKIDTLLHRSIIRYAFISGIFFVMVFIQFSLFLFRKKDKLSLIFSFVCIVLWIRQGVIGEIMFLNIFNNLDFDLIVKLEYASYYISVPLFAAFIYFSFPNQFSNKILKVIILGSSVFTLIDIIYSTEIISKSVGYYQIFTIISMLYGLHVITIAVIKKEEGAFIIFGGVIVMFLTVLNDILYANQIIWTGYYMDIGLLIVIVSLSLLINYRYMKGFETINNLTVSLENKNKKLNDLTHNLEKHVDIRTKELQQAYKDIENLALTDALTGLMNRHALKDLISTLEGIHDYNSNTFIISILDIDNFKNINDTYGHDIGDIVLKNIAKIAKESIRNQDYIARWGGEEFLLLFPNSAYEDALIINERIRMKIESNKIDIEREVISVTVTIGVCEYNKEEGQAICFKHADKALYYGKQNGKNQVVLYEKISEYNLEYK